MMQTGRSAFRGSWPGSQTPPSLQQHGQPSSVYTVLIATVLAAALTSCTALGLRGLRSEELAGKRGKHCAEPETPLFHTTSPLILCKS